ncbi:MAG: transposase, partial [Crenarchaeota archaeon]|nr:transposase [Thermoproteota archaeon]
PISMVHDVSRALRWLFTFSLNLTQKTFVIPTRYNCTYKARDILRALTFLSLESDYAEGGLKRLTKKLRRVSKPKKRPGKHGKKRSRPPDSDTFLSRLKQISRYEANCMLGKLNRQVLAAAKAKGAFRRKAIVAIDLTFIPYNGKKITRYAVGGKRKKGTSWFHCWATLRIVSPGRRFTIKARPVKRDQLDAEAMAKIVLELLAEAKTCGVHVRFVLLDKGFYNTAVIRALQTSSYKFLMAAKRNKNEKEAILDYFKTGKGQVRPFSFSEGDGEIHFQLSIHRFNKKKSKRVRNILELYGAFATNLGFKEAVRVWSRLPEDYRKRWGIETGYRVDGVFRAKTTSTDERLRFIYYEYMVFLENLWTLHNMAEAKRGGFCLDDVKRLSVTAKEFCEDFGYLLVATCDRGPPWLTI